MKFILKKENIKEELGKLEYPLYFLDYETFSPGVPLFDGYRPYQRMTFSIFPSRSGKTRRGIKTLCLFS